MSAILSAEALNDFIAPSVACIKPVENLPPPPPSNGVEVLRDGDGPTAENDARTTAQISLTDCLACSGCVTSSEAVLVQMQSHTEVLSALEQFPGKRFIALLSPQTRAALSVALGGRVGEKEVGNMVTRMLVDQLGFKAVVDTNPFRRIGLEYAAAEVVVVVASTTTATTPGAEEKKKKKKPVLDSSCPGFICYLESTHPELIPHLSAMKSPQAIAGTFLKALMIAEGVVQAPEDIYIVSIMPCFDKKLEGARGELTSSVWAPSDAEPVRDIDCVITTRELLSLALAKDISFVSLPSIPLPFATISRNPTINSFLTTPTPNGPTAAGTSGGNLVHILHTLLATHPGTSIKLQPGRNADTLDYILTPPSPSSPAIKLSRCYGFRNIQNLVRRLKPAKPKRALPQFGKQTAGPARRPVTTKKPGEDGGVYVEVMACPGGCTNGGGQVKWDDKEVWDELGMAPAPISHKELLSKVDEAYFSDGSEDPQPSLQLEGLSEEALQGVRRGAEEVKRVVGEWRRVTRVGEEKLLNTGYRKVANDLGGKLDESQALQLASGSSGGW